MLYDVQYTFYVFALNPPFYYSCKSHTQHNNNYKKKQKQKTNEEKHDDDDDKVMYLYIKIYKYTHNMLDVFV